MMMMMRLGTRMQRPARSCRVQWTAPGRVGQVGSSARNQIPPVLTANQNWLVEMLIRVCAEQGRVTTRVSHYEVNKNSPTNNANLLSLAPKYGGRKCEGHSIMVSNCTEHGSWSDWSPYGPCSQTCGVAIKVRRRTCSNPAPKHNGR
jgi:hypothetical protein